VGCKSSARSEEKEHIKHCCQQRFPFAFDSFWFVFAELSLIFSFNDLSAFKCGMGQVTHRKVFHSLCAPNLMQQFFLHTCLPLGFPQLPRFPEAFSSRIFRVLLPFISGLSARKQRAFVCVSEARVCLGVVYMNVN